MDTFLHKKYSSSPTNGETSSKCYEKSKKKNICKRKFKYVRNHKWIFIGWWNTSAIYKSVSLCLPSRNTIQVYRLVACLQQWWAEGVLRACMPGPIRQHDFSCRVVHCTAVYAWATRLHLVHLRTFHYGSEFEQHLAKRT